MPAKTDLATFNCSLARSLAAVGDWWTLLILRDAMFGSSRFAEFRSSLGIASNILSTRLAALVDNGIMSREGGETRPVYLLTTKGQDLAPAILALMQWGDRWESEAAPVIATDSRGRQLPRVQMQDRDGAAVTASEIRFKPGPGADDRTRAFVNRSKKQRD